jgi:hypothetical protein
MVSRRKNLQAATGERGFLAFSRRAGRGKKRPPAGVEGFIVDRVEKCMDMSLSDV